MSHRDRRSALSINALASLGIDVADSSEASVGGKRKGVITRKDKRKQAKLDEKARRMARHQQHTLKNPVSCVYIFMPLVQSCHIFNL
jgi:hypothetical protein